MHTSSRTSHGRARERGSAYLLVLLLLLVLTVIGLSLSVITQTELQIGGAERTATRVFYGGDSGIRFQFMLSRFNATRQGRYSFDGYETTGRPISNVLSPAQVDVSAFLPTYTGPCNLCTVNMGDARYWLINYVTNAQGLVTTEVGGTETVQGTKLLTAMFYVQPEQDRRVDQSVRVFDSEQLADDADEDGLDVVRY